MSGGRPPILLFEDVLVDGLGPVVQTRPAFELRVGVLNLRERVELIAGDEPRQARVRPLLRDLLHRTLPELVPTAAERPTILLNARLHGTLEALARLRAQVEGGGAVWWQEELVAALVEPDRIEEILSDVVAARSLPALDPPEGLRLFHRPWELVAANGAALCTDFRELRDREIPARRIFGVLFEDDAPAREFLAAQRWGGAEGAIVYPGVHVLEPDHVLYGEGASVKPGVVLDAEDGPILLGKGCRIQPNSVIQGPAYVGPGATVNPGAKLREGSGIGSLCKVGGEVEESILLDLSNKQHDGFLGHALVGSWANLGADTNGSDLKNNYGSVRVDLGEGPIDSGERFVGPHLGDHAKTGINTMLTTGAVVGVGANVFGGGFPPRHLPAFSWGGVGGTEITDIEKAVATARVVHGRRQARWLPENEALLRALHARRAG